MQAISFWIAKRLVILALWFDADIVCIIHDILHSPPDEVGDDAQRIANEAKANEQG